MTPSDQTELDKIIPHRDYGRGAYTCKAHDEGQLCCTDLEHDDFPLLKADVLAWHEARLAAAEQRAKIAESKYTYSHAIYENEFQWKKWFEGRIAKLEQSLRKEQE